MPSPLLVLEKLNKSFPGVRALRDVDLTIHPGEIHALMGENGAGKSTLIKVLTGVHARDGGRMLLEGHVIDPKSPRDAEEAGISTVYQEVNLVRLMSVAENIMLGRQPVRFGCVRWAAVRERARAALGRLGLSLDVDAELASFSMAIQQMVAIARALDVRARVLILDEPTSSLDDRETAALFKVMRQLRDEGLGIVFVTHFLDQVYAVADRVTVLRNGAYVGTFATGDLPRLHLIGAMLGREFKPSEHDPARGRPTRETGGAAILLEADRLGRRGSLHPVTFDIREGEVVGMAGLLGSGRTETARLLFGADRADQGEVRMAGRAVRVRSPRDAIRLGIGFCSEDRKSEGLVPNLSVRENLILAMQASRGPLRLLPRAEQDQLAAHYIRALDIKTGGPETPIQNLSGGNQQKVLLARWLAMRPKLILLDEPTRGIDIGAKAEIEKLVASLRDQGVSVVFISSELEEVVRNCQRVLVLRDRRLVGELEGDELRENEIMNVIARHDG